MNGHDDKFENYQANSNKKCAKCPFMLTSCQENYQSWVWQFAKKSS
jgi:hypothetical protein